MGVDPRICPSCKEKNNPAFTHCWKCKTAFATDESSTTKLQKTVEVQDNQGKFWFVLVLGTLIVLGPEVQRFGQTLATLKRVTIPSLPFFLLGFIADIVVDPFSMIGVALITWAFVLKKQSKKTCSKS